MSQNSIGTIAVDEICTRKQVEVGVGILLNPTCLNARDVRESQVLLVGLLDVLCHRYFLTIAVKHRVRSTSVSNALNRLLWLFAIKISQRDSKSFKAALQVTMLLRYKIV